MFGFTKRKNSDIQGGWTDTINGLSRGWDGWTGDVKSTQGKTSLYIIYNDIVMSRYDGNKKKWRICTNK